MVTRSHNGTAAIALRRNVVSGARCPAVRCKFCGSFNICHFGYTVKGQQRYLCTGCRRTFLDNKAPAGMRFPAEAIASALNQFYESASLCKIQRQLELTYKVRLHHSTVYRWVVRYSQKAAKMLSTIPVKAGSRWIVDETSLKLKDKGGSTAWFWDVMDEKTRFLLASHLAESRSPKDIQTLMERAVRRAGRIPRTIITDKLGSYLGEVGLAFGTGTGGGRSRSLRVWSNINLIDRLHEALKVRAKVTRSFMRRRTARMIMDGWLVHYNFFRPHPALSGKTPAEAAGAQLLFKNWADVVNSE